MNDKTKQALELASEELQFFHIAGLARLQTLESITAIKEAIALETVLLAEQPAQQWTDETAKVPDHVWGTPPFRFRRFVYGQERAQDVLIEREETLERAIKKAARICPPSEMTVLVYEGPRPQAREPLTDAMVVEAARMLSDRQAAACNVDCGDMWKMHGNEFIDDARAALEAAHGIKEKNT